MRHRSPTKEISNYAASSKPKPPSVFDQENDSSSSDEEEFKKPVKRKLEFNNEAATPTETSPLSEEKEKLSATPSTETTITINSPSSPEMAEAPLPKKERAFIFRWPLIVQTGLSNFFTGNFITEKVLGYFNAPKPYIDSISPTIGGLLGTFSSVSFLLGNNDFIDKKSFDEKPKLLAEIKEMDKGIDLLKKNLQIYEQNKQKKLRLAERKRTLENTNLHPKHSNRIISLFSKKSTKNPEEDNSPLLRDSKKNNYEEIKLSPPHSRCDSYLENLGGIQSAISGGFTGYSITTNLLALGGMVSTPISFAGGIGMSALYGICTYYTTKERKKKHDAFTADKMEIKTQQNKISKEIKELSSQIQLIKKQKTPLSLLKKRRFSTPAAHPIKSLNVPAFETSTSPTPATHLETKSPDPSSYIEEKESSAVLSLSARSCSFLEFEQKEEPSSESTASESYFTQLCNRWDSFKTNHFRLLRTIDVTQATLAGFAAGYSMTRQFAMSIPSAITGICTSALFAASSYKETGEFIVSKELFDAGKRNLKKQQEDLKHTLSHLHDSLANSNNLVKEEVTQLQRDIKQLKIMQTKEEKTYFPTPTDETNKKQIPFAYHFFKPYQETNLQQPYKKTRKKSYSF